VVAAARLVLRAVRRVARPSHADEAGARRRDSDDSDANAPDDPALRALRERYARGEIDEREFERKLDRLLETEDAETVDRSDAEDLAERVRDGLRREVERVRE